MYEQIKRAVSKELKKLVPSATIYTETVQQSLVKPAFFITILPVKANKPTLFSIERSVIVDIRYISENETRAEGYEMADTLALHFATLTTEDETYTLRNARFTLVDSDLHYLFDIDTTHVTQEDTTGYDTVGTVEIKIQQGGE